MKRNRNDRSSRLCSTRPHALRARRFFRPLLEQFEDRRLLAAVTVNTALDVNDGATTSIAALLAAPGADGLISLREAILAANNTANVDGADADSDPDPDAIHFNIPGPGVRTITPTSGLPTITEAVVIDGYTQPGASANTLAVGSDAVLLIEINGSSNGGRSGLVLGGVGGSTVRGLVINRSGGQLGSDAGIFIASNSNVVAGNFVGTDAAGSTPLGNPFGGVRIASGDNNLIGGTTPADRNLISGNRDSGNVVVGSGFTKPAGTTIRGNYIGTNAAGTAAITTNQNLTATGVRVLNSANTTIGGADLDDGAEDGQVGARNLISGNSFAGIHIEKQSGTWVRAVDGVTIVGNFIGVNASGVAAIPNSGTGIAANEGVDTFNLIVGGTAPGAGNVISGNRGTGFAGGGMTMTFEGNFVGTDLSGTLDLGNGIDGSAGQGNGGEGVHVAMGGNEGPNFQITVGGTTPAARNIISGNAANGVLVTGLRSGSVTVQGNFIGTQADGQTPLPNQFSGISMNRSLAIGGTVAGAGNVIAFNRGAGVSAPTSGSGPFVGMPILGNTIHSNLSLGIDLNGGGPSLNDLGDTDTDNNNNGQNFPVLTGVNAVNGNTVISGRLNSTPSSNFRIEFFYNDVRDSSGFGEGQNYLGFTDVTTDSSGNVSFVAPVVPGVIPAGRFVTATATVFSRSGIAVAPETSEFSFALASLIVTNTLDSGIGSLREAITLANTFVNFDRDGLAGNDVDPITFAIPAAGVQTVTPISALPQINEAVSIDGYTQPGASANTLAVGNNAVLQIELSGASVGGSANGLTLASGGSTVRGLAVNRFGGSGVELVSGNNVVEGSYLGIDPGGTIERSNLFAGVRVSEGANNRIGGTTTQARNVLAGNGSTTGTAQIVVGRPGNNATLVGTVIQGNYIGVNSAGSAAVHPTASGNDDGIYVARGVSTIIGGADADDGLVDGVVMAGNVISGNLMGIRIDATGDSAFQVRGIAIQGNMIGLDAAGTQDVGNFADGISAIRAAFTSIASSIVQIGGTQPGAGNIISANDGRGFIGSAANLVLEGNRVGTDVSGTLNFGNGSQGVHVSLFGELGLNFQIRVGGTTPAARNIISGNAANGVLVADAGNVTTGSVAIQGNYIGTQADGQSPLPNLSNGIELQRNGSVGGTAAGAGNVIAFNRLRGVNLLGGPTMPILGNSIFRNGSAGNSLSHLGIDLGGNGVTLNDPNDDDFGVNRLQNFPVISSATLAAGTLTFRYAVPTSTSNSAYPLRIEFFKADIDGQEGQAFLGFDTYTAAEAGTVKTVALTPAVTLAANDKVVATATDNLGNSSEFSASHTVTAANQPPVITSNGGGDTATIAVPENTTAVTTVAASDPDAGAVLTYSIVGGADAGRFSINATSGVLAFATAPNFEAPTDADANNNYLLIVQASDGTAIDTQTISVTVTDANEPPVITSNGGGDSASVTVPENTTAVSTVTATDPDAGATLNFGIVGGADGAQFSINATTGALRFIAAPNFETPADANGDNSYDVVVQVSDGSLTDLQLIAVTVTNANEPPVITSNGGGDSASISVPENTTAVTTVTASDPDTGPLNYSIRGGADASLFAIDSQSGELTFNTAPNFEAPTDAGANGVYDVIVEVSDGVNIDTQTLAVTVTNVNEAPVASDDAFVVAEDATLAVAAPGVLGNDTDVDGDSFSAALASGPAHGTLTLNGDGSMSYVPDRNFYGSDSFTYQLNDGTLESNVATATITVSPVNDAPAASPDSYTVNEDDTLTVAAPGVLNNDTDVDRNPITAVLLTDPTHGTLTLNPDGSLSYTPDANFSGSDSFSYKANDGTADSAGVTVTITVSAVNDAPVANDDAFTVAEDNTLTIVAPGVLDNDTDVEGSSLTAVVATGPVHGSLTLAADGSLSYTPSANFHGTDSFTYRASDGTDRSNAATVTINVGAVNNAPIANGDAYFVAEDNTLTVPAAGVLANDTDVDNATLTAVLVTGPAHGTVTLNANGSFTYTPHPNYNGSDSFSYRANDGAAHSNLATVLLTVGSVNDVPTANPDAYALAEDTTLTVAALGVLGNDTDVDGNTLTGVVVTGPAHGSLTLNPNGSLTYMPRANFNGSDSFSYRANDGTANSNVATVTLTVTAANDAPVAANDAYVTNADQTLNVASPGVLNNDSDVDGDSLMASLVTVPSHGVLTLRPDGSFTYTPAAGFSGTDSFVYRATDGVTSSNPATVTIVVNATNQGTPGKITGGGSVDERVRNFGFIVQTKVPNGVMSFTGSLEFHEKALGYNLHSTAITLIRIEPDGIHGMFSGTATVNQVPGYTFTVNIEDNGEPGARFDRFRIRIQGPNGFQYDSNDYSTRGGLLDQGGNIQVHRSPSSATPLTTVVMTTSTAAPSMPILVGSPISTLIASAYSDGASPALAPSSLSEPSRAVSAASDTGEDWLGAIALERINRPAISAAQHRSAYVAANDSVYADENDQYLDDETRWYDELAQSLAVTVTG